MECRLCSGECVHAEEWRTGGIHTMSMMVGMLTGKMFDDDDEHLKDGIKLEEGNLLCFDNSSREYTPLGIRISYCPLCGKELYQESNEEEEEP